MAKQIIWSPLAKEALKDLLISSQERDGNIRYIIPHPDYTLLYRHSLRKIEVLVLWNNHHKLGSMINIIREEPDTE